MTQNARVALTQHPTPAESPLDYSPTSREPPTELGRPYIGVVETELDALRLVNAARQSVIPLTTRRLNRHERKTLIRSGAVFVFNPKTSNIRRWTDGIAWTISYNTGNCLLYYKRPASLPRRVAHRRAPTDQLINAENLTKKVMKVRVGNDEFHLVAYFRPGERDSGILKDLSSRPDILALPVPVAAGYSSEPIDVDVDADADTDSEDTSSDSDAQVRIPDMEPRWGFRYPLLRPVHMWHT
ncbi:hypothetical protein MKEN_00971300 [Mycena kentingensis (nom. inval.)]|nr:hypothetical protein MKEN_00971300 [Mycena kentingensis (nom. inval.)]